MRRKKIEGRISYREQLERNQRAICFYAGVPYKENDLQKALPPKRDKITRPSDKKPAHQTESAVNDAIYDAAKKCARGCKLWRNNRGVAQYGNYTVAYGVGPRGASDWIGYRRVLVTADKIGSVIAQFVAIEAKAPGEKTRDDQQAFIDKVNADGGLAGCATSGAEAEEILDKW